MNSGILHILNGDALRSRFPIIPGRVITMRECLMEGPVQAEDLQQFFNARKDYLAPYHSSPEDYSLTISELMSIEDENLTDIYLWFEDDLFCQVNMWFCIYLCHELVPLTTLWHVRSGTEYPYSFGALSDTELTNQFKAAKEINRIEDWLDLWDSYRKGEPAFLREAAWRLEEEFPFVLKAADAHIARNPSDPDNDKPSIVLREIITEMKDPSFGEVFREFCRREPVYGYGDLQIKKLYDKITA